MTQLMPNLMAYWDEFIQALNDTWQMFFISGFISLIFGFLFALVLIACRDKGIAPNKPLYALVSILINVFRSIPFIILLIFLIPFTRLLVHTAIGVKGAIVPLVFGTVPFYTRQVETALENVESGKIEAARSMGISNLDIIWRVYIHEAVPELIRVTTTTAISLIGLTTMAGAVGAGGIGSFAINFGQSLHNQDIVNVCVVILLLLVSIMQTLGNYLSKRTTNRELFRR